MWGAAEENGEQVRLEVGGEVPLADWFYAPAAPFATTADNISMSDIMQGWNTGESNLGRLILDNTTSAVFSQIWGPPSPSVQVVEDGTLIDSLWAGRPSWTLIAFDELVPGLKVLTLDDQSLLDPELDISQYPLSIPIGLNGSGRAVQSVLTAWGDVSSNRNPDLITRVSMTGVTALSRATAYQMELRGITTPGLVVGPVLEDADIAHISHEVSFVEDCPYPNPIGDPIFCARDEYLELLTSIGADVIELTGNHLNDWGAEYSARSIDMYEAARMHTFGGGRNLEEAEQPLLLEINGSKIAFVGCNPVGPAGDWADTSRSGSRPCDYDALYQQIRELKEAGYLVIATLQYAEYYSYAAPPNQTADFRALIDAGADAVSGSQGHHAQGFDLYKGGFIHYGLGNLFFDQMDMLGTRQSFIDTYVINDGKLISVELFTSLIEDWCCPRAMTAEERVDLLETVFEASGW
jgi:poly-gamma-glutamate synthesis protein (capsule biosynthesis protein)